ncbi:HD domain-containing protein [Chryseobacterium tongliaoense]|uniref:HD domain-containing protein n=1 Tax=Chryseobacterium tongliaoense TaxID=3240933 RepID=UPI0035149B2D
MMHLHETFRKSCLPFTSDQDLINNLWWEIEQKYSEKKRYYHNLEHLGNMFSEIEAIKDLISDFSNISFAIFYHDVIYDASSKTNEEKSAEFAQIRFQKLSIDQESVDQVCKQILATKMHQKSGDIDTNYLLDADLSILGKDLETYLDYTRKIRKEYSIYPDFLYKPGRKKVLQHFSELENIFKTDYFKDQYEVQAKLNIEYELRSL